jgi:hypothetical protein
MFSSVEGVKMTYEFVLTKRMFFILRIDKINNRDEFAATGVYRHGR